MLWGPPRSCTCGLLLPNSIRTPETPRIGTPMGDNALAQQPTRGRSRPIAKFCGAHQLGLPVTQRTGLGVKRRP